MDTRYNIIYFPSDIDIRLCPKNASVSIKHAWYFTLVDKSEYTNPDGGLSCAIGENYRKEKVEKLSSFRAYPFRKNSTRIAIKRDPVERFLSAACYFTHNQKLYNNHLYSKEHYERNFILRNKELPNYPKQEFKSVPDIINALENGVIKDIHFFSQTHYLGHPDDYDYVFDINNLSPLWDLMNERCYPKRKLINKELIRNMSNVNKKLKDTVSEKDKELIREFYERDYRRGWH